MIVCGEHGAAGRPVRRAVMAVVGRAPAKSHDRLWLAEDHAVAVKKKLCRVANRHAPWIVDGARGAFGLSVECHVEGALQNATGRLSISHLAAVLLALAQVEIRSHASLPLVPLIALGKVGTIGQTVLLLAVSPRDVSHELEEGGERCMEGSLVMDFREAFSIVATSIAQLIVSGRRGMNGAHASMESDTRSLDVGKEGFAC